MNPAWSIVLGCIGVFGIYLAGRKNKLGWAVGFFSQGIWFTYAIVTQQWGFIITAVGYGYVYGKNWLAWYKDERDDNDNGGTRGNRPPDLEELRRAE